MEKFLKFILIVWLASIYSDVSGQVRCVLQRYTTEDGLSHTRSTSILKDQEGFIWTGSWDGINRFDSHSFISYRSFPGDKLGLMNDRIDDLVDDKTGFLWLKGVGEFYRFNKKTEHFQPLSLLIPPIRDAKIQIKKVQCYDKGVVWITTRGKGVFLISDPNARSYRWYKVGGGEYNISSDTINFVFKDSSENIWLGTSKGLTCLFKDASYKSGGGSTFERALNFVDVQEDKQFIYFSTKEGFIVFYDKRKGGIIKKKVSNATLNAIKKAQNRPEIYCSTLSGELLTISIPQLAVVSRAVSPGVPILSIFEDRSAYLWLEPQTVGVIRYDPRTGNHTWFNSKEEVDKTTQNFKVFEDESGTVWISMKGGKFGYFNPTRNKIERYFSGPEGDLEKLPDVTLAVYYDPDGLIWLSTNGGLVKIILSGKHFQTKSFSETTAGLLGNQIRALYSDRQNRLWVGSKGGQLRVLKQGMPISDLFVNLPPEGFGSVYAVLQDRNNSIWIGTKTNGIFKAVPISSQDSKYRLSHYRTENSRLTHNDIFSLYEDQAGRIWIGTFGGGLNLILEKGMKVDFVEAADAFSKYPKDVCKKVRHIASDKSGNLWVATTDGLLILGNYQRPRDAVIKLYTKRAGDKYSLADNDVQSLLRDKKGRMWLSTAGGGLAQARGRAFDRLRFEHLSRSNGLPSDFLLSSIEDDQGNLWLGTQNGLSCFDPVGRHFKNFDHRDGLLRANFTETTCAKLEDGSLVFGTDKGYFQFQPRDLSPGLKPAPVVFTGLRVNNSSVYAGGADSLLNQNINYANTLTLEHHQNMISIGFSILNHKAGRKGNLMFRLRGLNDDWQNDYWSRTATYTNLPPGEYYFEVKDAALYGRKNSIIKSLQINILPPPWKTWWAYSIYIILFAVLLGVALKIIQTVLRLRHNVAVQAAMAELKVDFFTRVAHELRTPLTLILNPAEEIEKKEHLSSRGQEYIAVVRKNAGRMINFVNEWLDLRRIQNGKVELAVTFTDLVSLIRNTARSFNEQIREKNLQFSIVTDTEEVRSWFDAGKMDVVIYNLLSNSFKYSPRNGRVMVKLSTLNEEGVVSISVSDEGPGIMPGDFNKIFELYYAGAQPDCKSKGIGIGLALCRELIDLHHGSITAHPNEPGGLTVTVELRGGKSHFKPEDFGSGPNPEAPSSFALQTGDERAPHRKEIPTELPADAPLVLLVEDNDDLRRFLATQLKEYYRVDTAVNGLEGFERAVRINPQLILTDVMMPVMDGIEMLDKLKHTLETSHIPVVLLSALSTIESQIRGLDYGADFYITKPFHNDHLISAIDNLISKREMLVKALFHKNRSLSLEPEEVIITSRDEEFLKKVLAAVEQEISNSDFNIDKMAGLLAMGRTSFNTKFKSLTNLTPVEFVRDVRLKRAKQLFDAGEKNVSTVAYSCGFNSPKYFSTCFKQMYKFSPTEYLSSRLNGQD